MLENGKMGCLRRVFEAIFGHNVINRHFFRGIRGHFFSLIRGLRPANLDCRISSGDDRHWWRLFSGYSNSINYPSPADKSATSPARGEVTRLLRCARNDICCLGRSMIEMLGVLAIIGVLSVGGIAGYSKAMEMWKISKQKQQIAELFIQTINLKEYFMREYNKTQTIVSTAYIMNTIGVIPDGMEMVDDYNIQDSAGNNIMIYFNSWNHKANGLEYMLKFDIFQPNMSKRQMQNYCATFLEQSQAIAPYILNVTKRNYATENGDASGYTVDYFNFYSATPSDIYNFCKSCSSKYGCTLLLKFKL